ncbi:MAG: ParB N-terminal domain-containing protein [Clostridia bacterium]|nr:ParB N-terminal domain-containing protein [Clostridia bacterium]
MDKPPTKRTPAVFTEDIRLIKCDMIRPNPAGRRGKYHDEELSRLAKRFLKRGVGVPCVVEAFKYENETLYLLLSGEKIFRAALIAGIKFLPCVVFSNADTVVENQRDSPDNTAFTPPKAHGRVVIRDARLFYNSIDHAVELMRNSGVDIMTEKQETPSHTVLTIAVPKSPPI